jgi:hypothetical protein
MYRLAPSPGWGFASCTNESADPRITYALDFIHTRTPPNQPLKSLKRIQSPGKATNYLTGVRRHIIIVTDGNYPV